MIRCGDGSLYTGISPDARKRFRDHVAGGVRSAKYLKGRGPLKLIWYRVAGKKSEAQSLEYRLKKLPKKDKEDLVRKKIELNDIIDWVWA